MARKLFFIVIGLTLSVYFFNLSISSLEINKLIEVIRNYNLYWLLPALIVFLIGYMIRAVRWAVLCRVINIDITFSLSLRNILQGTCINNILPLRVGDAFRIFHIKKINKSAQILLVLKIFLIEKILDILVLFLGLLFIIYMNDSIRTLLINNFDKFSTYGYFETTFFIIFFIMILTLVFYRFYIKKKIILVGSRQFFIPLYNKTLVLFAYSLLIWIFEFATFFLVAVGFVMPNEFMGAFSAMVMGTLAAMIPSLPGYLGTFDYFAIQGMMLNDIYYVDAVAFVLLVRMVIWFPITIIGLLLFTIVFWQDLIDFLRRDKVNE